MNQKVWVIEDRDWHGSPGKSRMDDPSPAKRQKGNLPLPKSSQKSPAVSFSLSMLVWGSGQMYIGEYRPGSIFMAAMLLFYSVVAAMVVFRDSATRLVAEIGLPAPVLIIGSSVFFFVGLLFWLVNAVDAYCRTARLRSEPFLGLGNELWPLLGSLLFPGWGQFLNGQTRKGLFFLLFGVMGIFSVFAFSLAHYVWPLLGVTPVRDAFEVFLVAAFWLIPLSFLVWIVSAYDAFRSCRELARKNLRLKNAGYRARSQWTLQSLIPRGTAILGLLLAISVGMQFFPKKYYLDSLEKVRIEMLNSNMEIIPEMVGKAIEFLDR